MEIIAYIENDFDEKFGIPRQSGMAGNISVITLTEKYAVSAALRGIGMYSHIWLLWLFSENPEREEFSPTVRPPRLGGNERMGVFATRSPFRPNNIGLSCVKLIRADEEQCRLYVSGADLMNGTPIIDIKPYIPYSDCRPGASGGFSDSRAEKLDVVFSENARGVLAPESEDVLRQIISQDPRPQYHAQGREYTFTFARREVTFSVENGIAVIKSII